MGRNRWLLVLVVLIIGGPIWLWMNREPVDAQAGTMVAGPAVGRPAPDFTLTTLGGDTVTLSDLRGTPVVLNFWATWCGPCRREMPALQAAAERFDGQVLVLGVDQGEDPQIVQDFVTEMGVTFPIPLDDEYLVGDTYNIRGMPTTFFVDDKGIIRHLWVGEMNSVTLAEGIAKIWP